MSSTSRLLFSGGRVFDGTGAPLADADVVIEDGRIVEIGPGLDGDEVTDVTGKAVLPGLFDCHTHVVITAGNLLATLRTGITTIRDASGVGSLHTARTCASSRSGVREA